LNNGLDGLDFQVVNALAMGSRFPVSGASGGGRWLAVLLGFFLALLSTLEAIPTQGAAEYLENYSGARTQVITPTGAAMTTAYTKNGRAASVTEASGDKTTFNYSATTGRLASAVHAGTGGATVNYTGYDANGNLLSLNEGGNGTITRTYDGLNRVMSYTEAGKTIGYRYYASGKLAKVIYPGGTENGLGHIEYTYNADGRLYQVIDRLSSTTSPRTTTYSWNTDGRLATVTRPNGTVRTISYDAAGRPSGISDAGIAWGIGYYASDDIATLDVTPAVPPQSLAAVPATQMTFDAANRLATFNGQTVTHDLDGNMVSGPLPSTGAMGNYTYDSRNRLTGAGGFAYRYNAEGNRVGLTSANETTTLTVDPQGALPKVLERVKNGIRTRYVYGAGLQYEVNDAGSATYYHYDQSGNTAALTNQAGAIIERVVYSPYGTIRYRQSNFDTPFLYGGFFGVMTDANGLINMRARYYNPLTMRFLNSDPAMDGLNWYAYAGGNPINFADPTGYGAQKVLGAMNSGLNALGMVANSFLNLIPGQAAWQNSVASAQSGNYGQAAAHFGIMAAEMVVTAYTAGAGGSAIAASRAAPMAATAARVEAAVVKEGANNVAVRQGYLNALEAIPSKINTTLPLREQAMQAFNLRNVAKIDARAAMADGGALLNKTDPIPTIQDVVRRAYQDKGLVGDDMWRSILESSTRSRASVNQALGVGQ
jgi:RHS repeat-associated protein